MVLGRRQRWIPVRPEKVCEVAYDQMEMRAKDTTGRSVG